MPSPYFLSRFGRLSTAASHETAALPRPQSLEDSLKERSVKVSSLKVPREALKRSLRLVRGQHQSEERFDNETAAQLKDGFGFKDGCDSRLSALDDALLELNLHVGSASLRYAAQQTAIAAESPLPVLL